MDLLDYNRLEKLASDKRSSFLGPFVSYKEMKGCEYSPRGLCHMTINHFNLLPSNSIILAQPFLGKPVIFLPIQPSEIFCPGVLGSW